MAYDTPAPDELRDRLYKEIADVRFGMLGLVGSGAMHHFQPMTCIAEKDEGAVYFFTNRQTDLVKEMGASHDVMLTIQAKDQEFQACVHGVLRVSDDRERIDRYWSPFVAAWFPEGKDDPDLTLLKLDAKDARIWVSRKGPLRYAFDVAKANLTHATPDVGGTADVAL
jgi:general stress protein 26